MNKPLISFLLAAALLAAPVFASEPEPASSLPSAGDVIDGFEALEIRPYEAIDAQVVLFEHQKTGAQVIYIANDDTNRAFDLVFWTHAIDDTGLPHVFEHATLDGSARYPSKNLFFNLYNQTYNTYMNASTADRYTTYPVASLSEEQLLKYADFYTDSCFHPMIMEDESIFREEAWRYRMEDEDAPLTLEGTVYSEMLGGISLETQSLKNFYADAFPGSWIRFEQGGSPDAIPDMTYESLRSFHDLYYHPSNCTVYLYGQFDDYAAFLELLDKEFDGYEKRDFAVTDDAYVPLEASVENTWEFPAEAGSDTGNASSVYYGILLPDLTDKEEMMKLDLLSSLLSSSSSFFSQKMKTALPSASSSCRLDLAGPVPVLKFTALFVNPEDKDVFRGLVDDALDDLVKNGLPEELALAMQSSLVLTSRLMRDSAGAGVELIDHMASTQAYYQDPWSAIELESFEENIYQWSMDGTFTALAQKWLTPDALRVLSTTVPNPGSKEEKEEALAGKLEEIKNRMSSEDKEAIIEASAAGEEPEDASGYVRALQAVTTDTLPEEIPDYEIADVTAPNGVRHITSAASVSGVGIINLYIDAGSLSIEDLRWMDLLCGMQNDLDSVRHTREELALLKAHYLYNGWSAFKVLDENGKAHPYYNISWYSLDENLEASYDLAWEVLFEQKLDEDQIKASLESQIANMKYVIDQLGYDAMITKSLSAGNEAQALKCAVDYFPFYEFMLEVREMLEEDPPEVIGELTRIRELLQNRSGAIAVFAGDPQCFEHNAALADAFFERLEERDVTPADYTFAPEPASQGLITDSAVCFNGYTADYATLGLEGYDAGLEVVASIVTDTFLYPMLRDRYGAYGAMNELYPETGMYMISYRDPNLKETFDVYEQLPEVLREYEIDQETLDGYILSVYSRIARPLGELGNASYALYYYLNGEDPACTLTMMKQIKAVTPETIKASADIYDRLIHQGRRISVGGAKILRENEELFELIQDPLRMETESIRSTE